MPRILLVESSATVRHIQKNLLMKAGYEVEAGLDFESACALLDADANGRISCDAVVLGWSDHSLAEVVMFYTLLERPSHLSLPVLTLAHKPGAEVFLRAGRRPNTAFLSWKDYKKTCDVLANLLIDTNTSQSGGNGPGNATHPIRVLLVDDSATVRAKYQRLLTANGYDAVTAASVSEGFGRALEAPFDIAIIDYFMPDATGDVLCQRLRDHKTTSAISTAVFTGTYLDDAIKQSLDAGAVECMFKNESDELFLARLTAMSRAIRAHQSIETERERLSGILRSVGEGVYGVNAEGQISFANPACRRILGYGPEERLIGKSALELFHYADIDGVPIEKKNCALQRSYAGGEPIQAWETVFWHKSGAPIPVECTVYPLTIKDKQEGSVVAFRDISERKTLEDELRWQASHDALTKLFNRRYFEEQLVREVEHLKRNDEVSALLYLDLDRFKYINDTAGHAAGDRLLVEIAQQIAHRMRKSDLLARLGGDEFAVLLRNISRDNVLQAADGFREMLDHYMFVYKGKHYKINGTIGIAMIDSETGSASEVLANADIACHIAKGEGRNRSHLFEPENDNKKAMDVDLGWSSRLHEALTNDHLILHYQPIIPLARIPQAMMSAGEGPIYEKLLSVVPQNEIVNEALLRLNDPVWGVIFPGVFLPTAERFNMMDKLDYWVIKDTLQKMARLQKAGYSGMFTINLSAQTIANATLVDDIEALVAELNINTSKVIFEITETSAVSNLLTANELIVRLNALGCRLALDDFGSGFSSFSYLKNLPVDFIKIDGLFVRGVATDPGDRAIVQSMNDIAHSLGKQTVAEYVEDGEILQFLHKIGVDYVQGHYISPPIDISNLDAHTLSDPRRFVSHSGD